METTCRKGLKTKTKRSERYAANGLGRDHKSVHVAHNKHMNSILSFKVSRINLGNRVSLHINISCS